MAALGFGSGPLLVHAGPMPDDAGMHPDPIRHVPEELVPLDEGARRLGLAHDTARKYLSAGNLRGEKRQGRWWVWTPMPDALIARLESEVSYLRSELADRTEETRRLHHLLAGALERIPELPAGGDAPQERNPGPLRDDTAARASCSCWRSQHCSFASRGMPGPWWPASSSWSWCSTS